MKENNFQLTLKELKKAKKILKQKNIKENCLIHFYFSNSSGIGKSVTMKIDNIDESFDITDYSSW